MPVKYTNTKKWDDVWFSELTMKEKFMFVYLCDMCDIAGFLEVNERLINFHTGIEDVRGAIKSLSKSVVYKDGYVWIMKYIKHQRNLPLNPKNNAHKGIMSSIADRIDSFPEIFDILPKQDVITIKDYLGVIRGYTAPSEGLVSPTSNSNSNIVITDTPENESLIARLYKYFVGEENLMGEGVTTGTRKILAEAIHIMDVEEWKIYCDARLSDEFKAAPGKFFLEDGWRRYQDKAKAKNKENKQAESRRKEAEERKSLPQEEAPEDFKEFVKDFGKRSRKTETAPHTAS